ncbi:flagellar export chaperone FlgN [Lacimicrobium sp. SS2-24]|uniref:flagellar export chaperone FlgN n=1 Tax=Lacimicrobium sp. SS2-24 TaxID=2005569 RepID=UPI000B4B68BB|nr:flagellar export chaperone FlgN [Lacimicrobium sp. SS2-24]
MSQINEAMKHQQELLGKLQLLLDSELQLISSRDAEALINLVNQKEALLDEIQQQDQKIASLYSNDSVKDTDFDEAKAAIQKLVEDCQYRTQINATAVEQGQLRLEHLRNLIMDVRAKESLTYDKAGKKKSGPMGGGVKA